MGIRRVAPGLLTILLILLVPASSSGIGRVYAGIRGGFMELTSTTVRVSIEDHIAVTYVDQVFTNHSDRAEEAVYEFTLPAGAIITDLWLWIEGEPVQGLIMEKAEARATYESVIDRTPDPVLIDPALVEHIGDSDFTMRIWPFPGRGSRRVAMEYAQVLESGDGHMEYSFSILPEDPRRRSDGRIKRLRFSAHVQSQHPMKATSTGMSDSAVYQRAPHYAAVFFQSVNYSPSTDFHINMERTDNPLLPVLLAYGPGHHKATDTYQIGYYLLWAPRLVRNSKGHEFVLEDFGMTATDDSGLGDLTSDQHVLGFAYSGPRGVSRAGRYRRGGPVSVWASGRLNDEEVSVSYDARLATSADSDGRRGGLTRFIPRLWAYHKIRALQDIAEENCTGDLIQEIVDLAVEYRLVTRYTSLFAPDETVQVDPEIRERGGWGYGATGIADTGIAQWLGHDFIQEDGIWVDVDYRPEMPREIYEGHLHQPALLADFMELGQELLVVVDGHAYEIQPGRLILHQNAPNPFNSSTVVSFILPTGSAGDEVRLGVYNLRGQLVRDLALHGAGQRGIVTWDGLDQEGRSAASGVYLYRIEAGSWSAYRRMLLLR